MNSINDDLILLDISPEENEYQNFPSLSPGEAGVL
jgi:hypothetical protein